MRNKLQISERISSLILTAIIAISACLSSYYSYKTFLEVRVQANELKRQNNAQFRQELYTYIKDAIIAVSATTTNNIK